METPGTLDQLKDLAATIGKNEPDSLLSRGAFLLLTRLIDTPELVAVSSITKLAQIHKVSPSTLTRLAKRLGYQGFPAFQSVFALHFTRSQHNFYSSQTSRLLGKKPSKDLQERSKLILKLAEETSRNFGTFVSHLSEDELAGAVQILASASKIRIYGCRQFHALASFMSYGLGLIRTDVSLLDVPGSGIAEGLAQLEVHDVLVVASVWPYTRTVVDAANVAKRQGIRVIALTDIRTSPLSSVSDFAFHIPHESSFFSNSLASYMIFCEGLLSAVAQEMGPQCMKAIKRREEMIEQMHIELG